MPHQHSSPAVGPGVLLVIGSCMSLQLGASVAATLFPVLGAWGVTSLRMTVAAVVLLVLVRPRFTRWSRDQWQAVVLFGLALAGMNGFFYAAIARIPLSAAVSIEFLGPLVLAAVTSRKGTDFLWVLLALAGMAVLGAESLTSTAMDPLGALFALIAGAFWAYYVLTSARVGQAVPGAGGLAVALAVASVVLAPVGGARAVGALSDPRLLGLAVLTGLLASVIPYSLELAALRRVPSNVFSILLSLEPAFAALFGWLLLAQPIGPLRVVTVLLVISASVGTTLSASAGARRRRRQEEAQLVGTGAIPVVELPE